MALLATLGVGLAAQSEFLDQDQFGSGVSVAALVGDVGHDGMVQVAASGLASWSPDGFVDLGAAVRFVPAANDTTGSGVYVFRVAGSFMLVKQNHLMPFSLSLPASLDKTVFKNSQLDAANETETGTGYQIGLEAFRYQLFDDHVCYRFGLFASTEMKMDTTESLTSTGAKATISTYQEVNFGAILGLSFRPNRANRGIAVSVDLRPSVDLKGDPSVGLVVSITLVENKTERVQE